MVWWLKEGVNYSRKTSHCEKYVKNFESEGQLETDQLELPATAESTDVEYTSNETDLLHDAAPKQEKTLPEEVSLCEDRRSSTKGGRGTVGEVIGRASYTLKDNVPVRRSGRIRKKQNYLK